MRNDSIQKAIEQIVRNAQWGCGQGSSMINSAAVITTGGQFTTIINLDEDRPYKIFILMAPNYPEPAKSKEFLCPSRGAHLNPDKSVVDLASDSDFDLSSVCIWVTSFFFKAVPCKRLLPSLFLSTIPSNKLCPTSPSVSIAQPLWLA